MSVFTPRPSLNPQSTELRSIKPHWRAWMTLALFLLVALVAGGTVAGPGLAWDEPTYRWSQVSLQNWFDQLRSAEDWPSRFALFSRDSIHHYWQFNRFGHNFHPPMASYGNLATYALVGSVWEDIAARRLASALEFAGAAALLAGFLGRRWGIAAGWFAGLALATQPRLMGDAHIIGTDMPLLFFWVAAAVAFWIGQESRFYQWLFASLLAGLFLVKFSGVLILLPLGVWLAGSLWRAGRTAMMAYLQRTALLFGPWLLLPVMLLIGPERPGPLGGLTAWLFQAEDWLRLLFLWPMGILLLGYRLPRSWPLPLEMPWVVAALTPLVAITLNPTWWHHTLSGLASYLDLNLGRQGKLPDIAIYYLGQQYLYSLPWHNGWVLMVVTIPFGLFGLGLVGIARTLLTRDPLTIYLLLHMVTLPMLRMLPTPAHDGIRLFLPTFAFWAALAAWGAFALAKIPWGPAWARWLVLFAIGPGWATLDWVRCHPYELSYYNLGTRRAARLGFEGTYWYDALNDPAMDRLNEVLPPNARLWTEVDPGINSEVFSTSQSLGRLSPDITLVADVGDFAWVVLLAHASKATARTRLLYALRDECLSSHDGLCLVALLSPQRNAEARAIELVLVERGSLSSEGPLCLDPNAMELDAGEWDALIEALSNGTRPAGPRAIAVLDRIQADPVARRTWERLRRHRPQAIQSLQRWSGSQDELRSILDGPGYDGLWDRPTR